MLWALRSEFGGDVYSRTCKRFCAYSSLAETEAHGGVDLNSLDLAVATPDFSSSLSRAQIADKVLTVCMLLMQLAVTSSVRVNRFEVRHEHVVTPSVVCPL